MNFIFATIEKENKSIRRFGFGFFLLQAHVIKIQKIQGVIRKMDMLPYNIVVADFMFIL